MLRINSTNFKSKIDDQIKKLYNFQDQYFQLQVENTILQVLVDKAKQKAPFWKGVLKRSGRYVIKNLTKQKLEAQILFGGASAKYANAMEYGTEAPHLMGRSVIEYDLALWVQDKILKGKSKGKVKILKMGNKRLKTEEFDKYGITKEAKSIAWAIYKGGINPNGLKGRFFVKETIEAYKNLMFERFKKIIEEKKNRVFRSV